MIIFNLFFVFCCSRQKGEQKEEKVVIRIEGLKEEKKEELPLKVERKEEKEKAASTTKERNKTSSRRRGTIARENSRKIAGKSSPAIPSTPTSNELHGGFAYCQS